MADFTGVNPNPLPAAFNKGSPNAGKMMSNKGAVEASAASARRELWAKAKLKVMQRVAQERQIRMLQAVVSDSGRSNSLAAMEKAVARRRAKRELQDPNAPKVGDLIEEHIRLLYMIQKYTDESAGRKWMRQTALSILIYEGVVAGVFDWDYAPTVILVDGKRVTLNMSQEGRAALDELREHGLVYALKLSSKTYAYTTAIQTTELGRALIRKRLSEEDAEAVDSLVYAPGETAAGDRELKEVIWDRATRTYSLVAKESRWSVPSGVTDVESVSYVTSPYIPSSHLRGTATCSDNKDRVDEMHDAKSTIKDEELSEAIVLGDVDLLIGEWIPMGANAMMMLNEMLGSAERVQGGFFSAELDDDPEETVWRGRADGLTAVNILDWDETSYVNYEAEAHFKGRAEGVIQVENFGVHVAESGFVSYGLRMDAVMDRIGKGISIDFLARVMVEAVRDTSAVANNLLTQSQRGMLELTFLNDAKTRQKYTVLVCEEIHPKKKAGEYLDGGEFENELKQVLGDTYGAYDLSESEVLIIGQQGLLLAGAGAHRHEKVLMAYLSLMTRNVFMRQLYRRSFILNDDLARIRKLIETQDADPAAVSVIRSLIRSTAEDVSELGNISGYLQESLQTDQYDASIDEGGSKRVAGVLEMRSLHSKMERRTRDFIKLVDIARHDLSALMSMAEDISADEQFRATDEVERNTKHLKEVSKASERTTSTLELMQIVLIGLVAFALVDRVSGLYLGIAADIEWSMKLFDPILQIPGAWVGVNAGSWLVLSLIMLLVMRRVRRRSIGAMTINVTLNRPLNLAAWASFVEDRRIAGEHGETDLSADLYVKRYTWTEPGARLWIGQPPVVEMEVDERNGYALRVTLASNRRHCKLSPAELQAAFLSVLGKYGVFAMDEEADEPAGGLTVEVPGSPAEQKIGVGRFSAEPATMKP